MASNTYAPKHVCKSYTCACLLLRVSIQPKVLQELMVLFLQVVKSIRPYGQTWNWLGPVFECTLNLIFVVEKNVEGHRSMRSAKAQISLLICIVWSEPSLTVWSILGPYVVYGSTGSYAVDQMHGLSLHCSNMHENQFLSWRGSFIFTHSFFKSRIYFAYLKLKLIHDI